MTDISNISPKESNVRVAGKRGIKSIHHRPDLYEENFRNVPEPAPPAATDLTKGRTQWGMDGNDEEGCCVEAATGHGRELQATLEVTNDVPTYVEGFTPWGTDGTLSRYHAYGIAQGEPGPAPDEGSDPITWFEWELAQQEVEKGEGADDVVAFLEIDISSGTAEEIANRVHQAVINYNGVFVAVQLTDDAEQLFSEGKPWTVANGETPDPQEGHGIYIAAYNPTGDQFITWGALQWATVAWDSDCILQVIAFVTKYDADRLGIPWSILLQTIKAGGGTVSTDPPTAENVAITEDRLKELAGEIEADVRSVVDKALDDVEHVGEVVDVEAERLAKRVVSKARHIFGRSFGDVAEGPVRNK